MNETDQVKNRQVVSPSLESRYFERMARSLGDKYKLLKFLPSVDKKTTLRILDVGAGGGEFAYHLNQLGYDVTALDASDDAIIRIREKFPELSTITLLANQADKLGVETFDAVICSSILHEVYSYGDNFHQMGHMSSLARAVEAFHRILKPGGRLLVRDGVLPNYWEKQGTLTLLGDTTEEAVFEYIKLCPFANGTAYGNNGWKVGLTQINKNIFSGNVQSLLEFAYTYTWGVKSYPRETQELYAVQTLNNYEKFFNMNGFKVIHKESYLQDGYREHLENKLLLHVENKKHVWFDSNAIWIANKI